MEHILVLAQSDGLSTGTIVTVLGTALASLGGAITIVAKTLHSNMKEAEKRVYVKLDRCEEDHRVKDVKLTEFAQELGELKGRIVGHEEVKQLATDVAEQIAQVSEVVPVIKDGIDNITMKLETLTDGKCDNEKTD